ncbi:ubinuclein-2-like isoform X2 [Mobula hypostoma]|uniref:ubinuclein-2-like isoform X2 n=1 Tax=Mobula hypostoma TaxID=723540 RepID=UPI002FC2B372
MLLYLLVSLLGISVLLAIALYLIRGRSHSQQLPEVSRLDAEQDLMQSNIVFGNVSGKVETPDSSEVFNELVTFQSSLGDDHSLLLRRSKQRSLLSRLKLSTFKSKKAEWSQGSKAAPERSMADLSSLGESVTSLTQVPAPVGPGEKADRSKSLKPPPATTIPLPEVEVTQIPAPTRRSDEGSPTQLERNVVKPEEMVIKPETTVVKPPPLPEAVPPVQPLPPFRQTIPPRKGRGRQPVPRPRRNLEEIGRLMSGKMEKQQMVNEYPSDQQGRSEEDRKTTTSKVSEQMEKRIPKERKKLGKKSKGHPRLRTKPSTMLSVGGTDLWSDHTQSGTSQVPEAGSDVESETNFEMWVTQLEAPQSPKFSEERAQLAQPSKAKSKAEGKRKVKTSTRTAKAGPKERTTQP